MVSIKTPDIVNGRIRRIEVKNDKYHDVNLKMLLGAEDGKVDEYSGKMADKKSKIFEQFDF